jgi:phosphatidylserine/phosphatidylglycerophosphate/cardiolipin synthase-like enzyme
LGSGPATSLVLVALGAREYVGDWRYALGLGCRCRRDGDGELSDRTGRRAASLRVGSRVLDCVSRIPAGASGSPFLNGNPLLLLNNGDAVYPPMLAAIRRAEASITIEAYIFWAGEIGLLFAEALAERAKSGAL